MSLSSLPDECSVNVLSFLDNGSLYECLFVNRYYCKLSIPMMWRDPFINTNYIDHRTSLINTLFSCLNEDEISSLIPCAIDLTNFNNKPPLFEYGRFVRKINHGLLLDHIIAWLYSFSKRIFNIPRNQDCRVQKLANAIYYMIMRTGSILREFVIHSSHDDGYYFDLPKSSIFTCEPGITDLRSLTLYDTNFLTINDTKYQNTIEFLSMVSKFCNNIIDCELHSNFFDGILFANQILDIIKLQPLKRILLLDNNLENVDIKKILYSLTEFRSETLKELLFYYIHFQQIDLSSFISKLKCLERLELMECTGFTFEKRLYLKELKLWNFNTHYYNVKLNAISTINSLYGETLLKLVLNIVTPEIVKAVKVNCPNVNFLCTESSGDDLLIPLICELPSLKTLNIKLRGVNEGPLIKLLSNHLISIEHLFLDFRVDLRNFEFFVNNCKAKLKSLNILVKNMLNNPLRKNYLIHVNNFQKIHNSLSLFVIKKYAKCKFNWTDEEKEIIYSLKNQGINTIVQ